MDPLSDVLSLLKPRSYRFGGFVAGGDWSIAFPRHDGIKCYAVTSGSCWLAVDGVAGPVRLASGDCFLLPRGWPFRLATDLTLAPIDPATVFPLAVNGGMGALNGGDDFSSVGGHFLLDGDSAPVLLGMLLGMLPPIVHIAREADKAALRWSMDRMRHELREPQPGGFLVAQQLAYTMLVQALRLHMADGGGGVGWLFALADRRMGAAIGAMHAEPRRRWSVQELARSAGMSRSSFAARFRATVGVSPLAYLTRWRMLLAADHLAHTADPVAVVAQAMGYESESAFSTAFRRTMQVSPRRFGRQGAGAGVTGPNGRLLGGV